MERHTALSSCRLEELGSEQCRHSPFPESRLCCPIQVVPQNSHINYCLFICDSRSTSEGSNRWSILLVPTMKAFISHTTDQIEVQTPQVPCPSGGGLSASGPLWSLVMCILLVPSLVPSSLVLFLSSLFIDLWLPFPHSWEKFELHSSLNPAKQKNSKT